MKTLVTLLLVSSFISSNAQKSISISANAQKSISISAGTTYSHNEFTEGLGRSLGYYAGIGFQDKFSRILGVDAELYYLNQINRISDITVATKSINMIFGVNIHPFFNGPYFILGPELGHSLAVKVEGENVSADPDLRFGALIGIGYQIVPQVDIVARYIRAIDDQGLGYDYNLQLGLKYKIFRGE
jgi:hypothetical protein